MPVRIYIVDDHTLLLDGLRMLLERQPDQRVVGTSTDGLQALRDIRRRRPDVVLMDISLPGLNGISVLGQLQASHPAIRVIVLTVHADLRLVRGALRAGAWGYLIKESAGRELNEAIREVVAGRRYLGEGVVEQLAAAAGDAEGPRDEDALFEQLSVREQQVFQLLAEGRVAKEIGALLEISPKTVDTYQRRLMRKLGLENMAALVKLAVQLGITTPW
jgi:DNA-binding NarL/FixJ family response regulator